MSSRASRWQAGNTPLSQHHGGTAAAARLAVKAAQAERLKEFQRAREIVRQQMAERQPASVEQLAGSVRRLRPRARAQPPRWNCRAYRHRLPSRLPTEVVRVTLDKAAAEMQRAALILLQGGRCALCGKGISEDDRESPTLRPSRDHVIPRDLGGGDYRNLVAAHNQCNADKTNDLPTGCELIWLLAVNARIDQLPMRMKAAFYGTPSPTLSADIAGGDL